MCSGDDINTVFYVAPHYVAIFITLTVPRDLRRQLHRQRSIRILHRLARLLYLLALILLLTLLHTIH